VEINMQRRSDGPSNEQLVIVMVGLPARGKTFLAGKLARYLRWRGYTVGQYNVGSYRRKHLGAKQSASFFDHNDPTTVAQRDKVARLALDDMLDFMRTGGEVGIYDATNSTRQRRDSVREECARAGLNTVLIESICDDEELVDQNIRNTKLSMPDYHGFTEAAAIADFRERIAKYNDAYEPVSDEEGSFIKYIDVGERVVLNQLDGHLPQKLVSVLLNSHLGQRPIYLTRHGETPFNIEERIGGDPGITERGAAYSHKLSAHLQAELGATPVVIISTLKRTALTAEALPWPAHPWHLLDEIDAGMCDGLTYAEVAVDHPDEWAARKADKFFYRYPRGESYADVIARLEPVIMELERLRKPVVVIAHQAVLRAVYAYFCDLQPTECPFLQVPLHTLIKLTPTEDGFRESRAALGT
jgi:broad specificity phosphatase PhoE/predicted kinase